MVEDWRRCFRAVSEEISRLSTSPPEDKTEPELDSHPTDEDDEEGVDPSSKAEEFIDLLESEEYRRIRVGDLPAKKYGQIKDERGSSVLVIDTENIPQKILLSAASEFESIHELVNGFAIGDRAGIAEAAKTEGTGGLVDEIYSKYRQKLPRRFLPVLKDALVLRVADRNERITQGEIYDWRGEIAGDHIDRGHDPAEAQNLISLCSAGYFDSDRHFDKLYQTNVEHNDWDTTKYKEVANIHIQNNPFAIFVSTGGMSPIEIYDLARQKADRLDGFPAPPRHIDICGRGDETRAIIQDTLTEFLEGDPVPDYEWMEVSDSTQHILRIEAQVFN